MSIASDKEKFEKLFKNMPFDPDDKDGHPDQQTDPAAPAKPVRGGMLLPDARCTETDVKEWCKSGLAREMKSAQRRGQPQENCDLHGLTVEEAWKEVDSFLARARASEWKVVQIIHGEGKGILKRKVRGWLKATREVNWFSEVPRNAGAVLLGLCNSKK